MDGMFSMSPQHPLQSRNESFDYNPTFFYVNTLHSLSSSALPLVERIMSANRFSFNILVGAMVLGAVRQYAEALSDIATDGTEGRDIINQMSSQLQNENLCSARMVQINSDMKGLGSKKKDGNKLVATTRDLTCPNTFASFTRVVETSNNLAYLIQTVSSAAYPTDDERSDLRAAAEAVGAAINILRDGMNRAGYTIWNQEIDNIDFIVQTLNYNLVYLSGSSLLATVNRFFRRVNQN